MLVVGATIMSGAIWIEGRYGAEGLVMLGVASVHVPTVRDIVTKV